MSAEKWIKWQFLKRNLEEKEFTAALLSFYISFYGFDGSILSFV